MICINKLREYRSHRAGYKKIKQELGAWLNEKQGIAAPNPAVNNGENLFTVRDEFAKAALQGICVNADNNGFRFSDIEGIANYSFKIADAMITEREK